MTAPPSTSAFSIPANFFWDISVRFLFWGCWDFWRRHDHFRRFPKKSEVFRRRRKSAEGEVIEKTLIHKIRDREEGIVIYSFYTWFSFLTWVWVNKILEIVSSKTATTQIFQSGVRNWPTRVRSKFSTRRRESWQVYFSGYLTMGEFPLSKFSKQCVYQSLILFTCRKPQIECHHPLAPVGKQLWSKAEVRTGGHQLILPKHSPFEYSGLLSSGVFPAFCRLGRLHHRRSQSTRLV